MTVSTAEQLIARLDNLSEESLFDLCNDTTQENLRRDFAETIDLEDRTEHVFAILNSDEGKILDLSAKLMRLWNQFLFSRDLRERYRNEIESNLIDWNVD